MLQSIFAFPFGVHFLFLYSPNRYIVFLSSKLLQKNEKFFSVIITYFSHLCQCDNTFKNISNSKHLIEFIKRQRQLNLCSPSFLSFKARQVIGRKDLIKYLDHLNAYMLILGINGHQPTNKLNFRNQRPRYFFKFDKIFPSG